MMFLLLLYDNSGDTTAVSCVISQCCHHWFQYWSWYSAPYTALWSWSADLCEWADEDVLHLMVWQLWMTIWNMACISCPCFHCWNTPSTASLCSHPLFGLQKCSASISECHWLPFFPHWRIQLYPFATSALAWHAILSDSPSASICHTATTCKGMSAGRFNHCCYSMSIHFWHREST